MRHTHYITTALLSHFTSHSHLPSLILLLIFLTSSKVSSYSALPHNTPQHRQEGTVYMSKRSNQATRRFIKCPAVLGLFLVVWRAAQRPEQELRKSGLGSFRPFLTCKCSVTLSPDGQWNVVLTHTYNGHGVERVPFGNTECMPHLSGHPWHWVAHRCQILCAMAQAPELRQQATI